MIIVYFRSSSYSAWDFCNQRYFLSYVLGLPEISNKAAEKGTIVHKILEVLAIAKKCLQDDEAGFKDDAVGEFEVDKSYIYSNAFVDEVTARAYSYYYGKSAIKHKYVPGDYNDCRKWTYKVIDAKTFDPRNLIIISPERKFELTLPYDWAKYSFITPFGEKLEGRLALKGTIDLVIQSGPSMYEIVDWKTGRRLNWNTGEEKTYEKLCSDPQLMLYHYCAGLLFPDIKQIVMTIHFINDGGPFTMAYSDDIQPKIEKLLRQRFEQIKATTRPKLKKSWKCEKLCHYGKNLHSCGNGKTICQHIYDEVQTKGMDEVIRTETAKGHTIGHYHDPGS